MCRCIHIFFDRFSPTFVGLFLGSAWTSNTVLYKLYASRPKKCGIQAHIHVCMWKPNTQTLFSFLNYHCSKKCNEITIWFNFKTDCRYNTGEYIMVQHGQSFIPAVASVEKLSTVTNVCLLLLPVSILF